MHLRKPHCLLPVWNIEILWKQQLILCMKLYCKCKGLTPGVTVLIPVAHRIQFSIYLSRSAHNWNLSWGGGRGGVTPCFSNHLYSCVIVAGYRHFWLSDMAADPVSAFKINRWMLQNKHGGRNQPKERDTWKNVMSNSLKSKCVSYARKDCEKKGWIIVRLDLVATGTEAQPNTLGRKGTRTGPFLYTSICCVCRVIWGLFM